MGRPRTKRSLALSQVVQTRVTTDAARKFAVIAKRKGLTTSTYLRKFVMDTIDADQKD